MSPVELAFRIGRGTSTLWRYESNLSQPSLAVARKIAGVLGVTVDELFPAEPVEEQAA